jgi:hypothetical protein
MLSAGLLWLRWWLLLLLLLPHALLLLLLLCELGRSCFQLHMPQCAQSLPCVAAPVTWHR